MSGSISPLLKDTSFGVDPATGAANPVLLATLNADQRIRTFFVEPGSTIAAGDWATVDLAGASTFGLGNSVVGLDNAGGGNNATNVPVGVALEAAAPAAGDSVWIRVVTRGVVEARVDAGAAVGDQLAPSNVAGRADIKALGAAVPITETIGYALEITGVAPERILCYVTCE